MKRLDSNLKILIAITVLLALSYNLMAQPQQRRMVSPAAKTQTGQFIPGLTEDQKSQMKELKLATMKAVQPLKDELMVNKAMLNLLVRKDNPDMNEIRSLVEATAEIQVKVQILTIESQIKTRNLLNEEQKVLLDARVNKMAKMRNSGKFRQMNNTKSRSRMGQQRRRI